MPMIETTIINSINVNASRFFFDCRAGIS